MRRMAVYCHIEKAVIGGWKAIVGITFFSLIAMNSYGMAEEASKTKPTTKSAIIISNKIDLKKITAGKPLTSGKTGPALSTAENRYGARKGGAGTGASAPIIVDKKAKVINGVIMTPPKKWQGTKE